MLKPKEVEDQVRQMLRWRNSDRDKLEKIYKYLRGKQSLPAVPTGVPKDVKRIAQMSRVNLVSLVIDVPAQSLFVDGYRTPKGESDEPTWDTWQRNKLDARQTGVHRAALAYGASYVTVLPGDPVAVISGSSPRRMTTVYGEDEDWPMWALERLRGSQPLFRLFDDEAYYLVSIEHGDKVDYIDTKVHERGVVPVVRFRNIDDLDDELVGEVEALIPIQDQIDLTTFDLLVAQHFQSFRQRYIIGWTAKDEDDRLKTGAGRWLTFEDDTVKVGEFGEVNLQGFLESREASVQHLATISQTPPHHLLGKISNLSAEALVAAESGHRRKITERETIFGEAWEQALNLAASIDGLDVDDSAQVRWRDTEARAFAATVDGLGKLATMLQVPVEILWEKIPGWTKTDVDAAKQLLASGDSMTKLLDELSRGQQSPEL